MINDECTNEKGDIRTVFWLHTTITIVPSRFSVIIAHYLFGSWIWWEVKSCDSSQIVVFGLISWSSRQGKWHPIPRRPGVMGYGSSREGQPQGRTLLGFATPLTRAQAASFYFLIFSIIFYNCPPVPRILWFYVGTLCGLEHTLSLISSSLLPLSAL